jgi:hypothetical protein
MLFTCVHVHNHRAAATSLRPFLVTEQASTLCNSSRPGDKISHSTIRFLHLSNMTLSIEHEFTVNPRIRFVYSILMKHTGVGLTLISGVATGEGNLPMSESSLRKR